MDGQLDDALRQHAVAIKRRAGPQEDRKLVQLPRLVPGRSLRQASLAARYVNRAFSSTFRRRRQRRRMAPRVSRVRGTRGRCTAPTA